jgi:hypothetical protein
MPRGSVVLAALREQWHRRVTVEWMAWNASF